MHDISAQFQPGRCVLLVGSLMVLSLGLFACGKGDTPTADQRPAETSEPGNVADQVVEMGPMPRALEGDAVEQDQPAADPHGVAIQVNDRVVTNADFEQELQEQMGRLEQQLGELEQAPEVKQRLAQIREQMKRQLVEQRITQMLLEDYLEKTDIDISTDEVDLQWSQIADQFPDEQALERMLQQEGVSLAEAREQVARQVKLDRLMARELGEIEVSDAEAQAFFDLRSAEFATPAQVRARHILLRDAEGAEEKIHAIHRRIEEGEDFEALASEFSECPSSAQGGDLGFFGEAQMVEPFSRQAFAMEPGEVSAPIQTQFGYHIIKVEQRRDAGQTTFAEVQDAIKEHLEQQRTRAQQDNFIEKLKQTAQITIHVQLPATPPSGLPELDELD